MTERNTLVLPNFDNEEEDDMSPSVSLLENSIPIVGREADPNARDNWEDDFDLDFDDEEEAQKPIVERSGSMGDRLKSPLPTVSKNIFPGVGRVNKSPISEDELDFGDSDEDEEALPTFVGTPPEPKESVLAKAGEEEEDSEDEDWDEELGNDPDFIAVHGNTTTKPDAGSDSEGDWDMEIAMEAKDGSTSQTNGAHAHLRSLFNEEEEDEEEEDDTFLHHRYRLLKVVTSAGKKKINVLMYPQPSQLHSLKLPTGFIAMKERELESWLELLTTKQKRNYFNYEDVPEWTGKEFIEFCTLPEYIIDSESHIQPRDLNLVLKDCLLRIRKLFRSRKSGSVETICSILIALRDHLIYEMSEKAAALRLEKAKSLLDNNTTINEEEYQTPHFCNDEVSFRLIYGMLSTAGNCIDMEMWDLFVSCLDTVLKCFQIYKPLLQLLKTEVQAHMDGGNASKNLRKLCRLYGVCNGHIESSEGKLHHVYAEGAARALTSLHLYLGHYSPLDTAPLRALARWDIDDDGFEWLDSAISGEEPTDELEAEVWNLAGQPDLRMQSLLKLYPLLPDRSLIKARSAYLLGRYVEELRHGISEAEHAKKAEVFGFECLYILDTIEPQIPNLVPIISELGINALIFYADTLIHNKKYKYAILAYEASMKAFKYLKGTENYALYRRLCDICIENEDYRRALGYYDMIKEKATRDGSLSMYLYIVQQISKTHVSRGNFRKAEEILRASLKLLRPLSRKAGQMTGGDVHMRSSANIPGIKKNSSKFATTPAMEFRSAILTLYTSLAKLYLTGDRVTNAISVLEMLRSSDLPKGKVNSVNLLLATAYMKKRQFFKAAALLDQMEENKKTALGQKAKKGRTQSVHMSGFHTGYSAMGGHIDVVDSPEYMEIRAKCYLYSGDYVNALHWANRALQECPDSSLTHLARFHYRRGKIFQAMLFADMMEKPALYPDGNSSDGSLNDSSQPCAVQDNIPIPHLPNPCECIEAFREAFDYFRKVDDNVRMAKALSRIAETYLHVAFVTVGVIGHSPDDMIPWLREAQFSTDGMEPFSDFLEAVEQPAAHALELCAETLHVVPMLNCYISMAEIRFLQGRFDQAISFWKECKDTFYALFMNGNQTVLVNKATPGFSANMKTFFKRMVRLMMCFEAKMINRNLHVLDAYTLYEVDLFSELLASYDDSPDNEQKVNMVMAGIHPYQAGGGVGSGSGIATGSGGGRGGLLSRRSTDAWKDQLNTAFGAVGSRSSGLRNQRKVSLMSNVLSDDDVIQQKNATLSESVCFSLYEISRACDRYSLGRCTQQEVWDRNRATLRKILKCMHELRELCGTEFKTDPSRQQKVPLMETSDNTGRRQSLSMTNLNSKAMSIWLLSQTVGDPLWGNLVYCIPMDNVIAIYSPVSETKVLRLYSSDMDVIHQSLIDLSILNRKHGGNGHGGGGIGGTAAAGTGTLHASLPGPHNAGSSLIDSYRIGGISGSRSTYQSTNSLGHVRTNSGGRSYSTMSIDPHLQGGGPGLQHLHPQHTHVIPSNLFMEKILKDFRERIAMSVKSVINPNFSQAIASRIANSDLGGAVISGRLSPRTLQASDATEVRRRNREKSVLLSASLLGMTNEDLDTTNVGLHNVIKHYEQESDDSADVPPCHECGCTWFGDHLWHKGFCRNCFHDHIELSEEEQKEREHHLHALLQSHGPKAISEGEEKDGFDEEDGGGIGASASDRDTSRDSNRLADGVGKLSLLSPDMGSADSDDGGSNRPVTPRTATFNKNTMKMKKDQLTLGAADSLIPPSLDIVLVREMFSALDPQNILTLFSALFGECRIIVSASSHFRIKAVTNSLLRLMYPFRWQHMFIPVLARECVSILHDKQPYIIGINSYILDAITPPHGVVVAHLDKNFVKFSAGSFINFPIDSKNMLYKCIVKFMSSMFLSQAQDMAKARIGSQRYSERGQEQGKEDARIESIAPLPEAEAEGEGESEAKADVYGASPGRGTVRIHIDEETGTRRRVNGASPQGPFGRRRENREVVERAAMTHLIQLRDGFLDVMVSLFYKYRLFWNDGEGVVFELGRFLDYTKQPCQPFIQSFVRSRSFRYFISVRSSVGARKFGRYLFDYRVERKLLEKKNELNALRGGQIQGTLLFAKGYSSSWSKRYVVVDAEFIKIFKSKKSKKPKETRLLTPGAYRIIIPVVESNPNFYSFELSNIQHDIQQDSFHFRALSAGQRKKWVRLLECRLMSFDMINRFDRGTSHVNRMSQQGMQYIYEPERNVDGDISISWNSTHSSTMNESGTLDSGSPNKSDPDSNNA